MILSIEIHKLNDITILEVILNQYISEKAHNLVLNALGSAW